SGAGHDAGVGVQEPPLALVDVRAVRPEVLGHPDLLLLGDRALAEDQLAHAGARLWPHVYPVEPALAEPGEEERGLPERLRGKRPGVRARTAEQCTELDARDT